MELFQLLNVGQRSSCLGFVGARTDIMLPKPHLGNDSELDKILSTHEVECCIIAIGDPIARAKCCELAEKFSIRPISFVSPNSFIVNSKIGAGSIIYPHTSIMSSCSIGRSTVVNCNATIGHDTKIGKFCNINPGANIAGFVNIGDYSTIGIGAIVKEGINIGANVMIGAGSVVIRDIPNNVVAYGNPAKYEL